jgi:hypothetical protein
VGRTHKSSRELRLPNSVGISPVRSLSLRTLRSPPPPPPYSVPHIHTHIAHTRQPPSTRTLSSPHHPAHPPSEPSLPLADPTLQGEAEGRAARTSIQARPESPSRWGSLRPECCCTGPCARHPHHRAVLSATHPHAQRSHPPASLYTNTILPSPPCSPTQRASLS